MQVTAPKPVIGPDRIPTAAETMMETNKTKEVNLKDLVHRVHDSMLEESDPPEEYAHFSDPQNSIALKELMNSISQSQQGIIIAEEIESGLFSIFEAVGISKEKNPVNPDKAKEFRENIAKQAEEVSSKLKKIQLYGRLIEESKKEEEQKDKPNKATENFDSYLQEGLGFLKQGQKKATRDQLKQFDEQMKKKIAEMRNFKEELAEQVEEKAQKAKKLMENIQLKNQQNNDAESPLEMVKALAKEILSSLSDPSLLHENLSHIRTAFYLSEEDEKEAPKKKIVI